MGKSLFEICIDFLCFRGFNRFFGVLNVMVHVVRVVFWFLTVCLLFILLRVGFHSIQIENLTFAIFDC